VWFSCINYTALTLIAAATLYPFWNLLAISLNDSLDAVRGGIYLVPREFTLANYAAVFEREGLLQAALLSVARTIAGAALGVLGTAMIAYALSRTDFVLRRPLNVLLIFTLFVNAGLLPTYLLIRDLGLMNTFAVYLLPLLISAYNVIIMRSYFESLPDGLTESAKIDGANDFQTLFRIILPVSAPVVATITLFIAVVHWNAWFDNYLYTSRTPELNLLQFELMKILQASANSQMDRAGNAAAAIDINPESIRAAMTMIVTVPILLVYPFLQRYFVKGIMVASMKE